MEPATLALQETVKIAQQWGDHACVALALLWLYHLSEATGHTSGPRLLERSLAMATELNMVELAATASMNLAKHVAFARELDSVGAGEGAASSSSSGGGAGGGGFTGRIGSMFATTGAAASGSGGLGGWGPGSTVPMHWGHLKRGSGVNYLDSLVATRGGALSVHGRPVDAAGREAGAADGAAGDAASRGAPPMVRWKRQGRQAYLFQILEGNRERE
jgi:hypothetical protein